MSYLNNVNNINNPNDELDFLDLNNNKNDDQLCFEMVFNLNKNEDEESSDNSELYFIKNMCRLYRSPKINLKKAVDCLNNSSHKKLKNSCIYSCLCFAIFFAVSVFIKSFSFNSFS